MIKTSSLLVLMSAIVGATGCGEVPPDVDTTTSALVGAPVQGVHGFTRNDGRHGVVWKSLQTGTVGEAEIGTDQTPVRHNLGTSQVGNTPWGYKRSDNVNAIMYMSSTDLHIHELAQSGSTGSWGDTDFSGAFGAPAGTNAPIADTIGYVRSDGVNAVVYRAVTGHIIEISSNFGHSPPWFVNDLTVITGAPNSGGIPFPYVRSDNKNAIVYSASDGHIHEIASNFGSSPPWNDNDLFAASGIPTSTSFDPWGYKRSDGINSVVFTNSGGVLWEISLTAGKLCSTGFPWCWGQLSTSANTSRNRPSGFVRWDNTNEVVYLTSSNFLYAENLGPSGWTVWFADRPVSRIVIN